MRAKQNMSTIALTIMIYTWWYIHDSFTQGEAQLIGESVAQKGERFDPYLAVIAGI